MAVKRSTVFEWISTVVRFGMAVILIAAAVPKAGHIPQSVLAVRAYQLLPHEPVDVAKFVGTMLPFLELALALFLLLGLFTRIASIVWLVMMAGFMFGVIWVWAHGYSIDCGCFGGGGEVDEGATNYGMHLAERVAFVALGVWLAIYPRTKFSLDGWMRAEQN